MDPVNTQYDNPVIEETPVVVTTTKTHKVVTAKTPKTPTPKKHTAVTTTVAAKPAPTPAHTATPALPFTGTNVLFILSVGAVILFAGAAMRGTGRGRS